MNRTRLVLFVVSILDYCVWIYGVHPDVKLNFIERAKRHGYPFEVHQAITDDGYLIDLLRFPRGISKSENEPKNKSVLLIMHGNGGSPHNFIAMGRKKAPAYYFADRNFDVWLICGRGVHCVNNRKHQKYDWNRDPEYWNFSFHECGIYDIAASIDYVLNATKQQKLFYIGHSSAVNSIFALLSERPEYNNKLKAIANYAGSPIITEMDYPSIELVCELSNLFKGALKILDFHEVFPRTIRDTINPILRLFCIDRKFKFTCKTLVMSFSSHLSYNIDEDLYEVILGDAPPRFASKALCHLMDNVKNGYFRFYDHGPKMNKKIYGHTLPRAYNISACVVPTAFFSGATDSIVLRKEMWKTQEYLNNTVLDYEIGPSFMHVDFLFARNATFKLYEPTVKLFNDINNGKIPPRIIRKRSNLN
ncbi:hypothetical protein GWI33_002495 [Rhynchophorus ferrugineus]|uniref:Lipase n=1 Tax=Rhynchophorus ferrugineus TaxID=354439 RepID=A0A834IXK3_RHYFE|nr:hypothetical protein GWI33_002495 [Rhynchophorus ferrugineus]